MKLEESKVIGEVMELFSFPFVHRMLIAGLLASVVGGIIGTYVVVNRVVVMSGGIAHITFGGIGLAYLLQDKLNWWWMDPLIGALVFALASGAVFSSNYVRKRVRQDSTVGVLWVIGMALGILFINLVDKSRVTVQDPSSILFGNILLIDRLDLYLFAALTFLIVLTVFVFFRDFRILTFDEEFARISGLNVSWLNLLLFSLIALTVVILIRVVGVVLVIAMLTIPAAISSLFNTRLSTTMGVAVVIGLIGSFLGIFSSLVFDTPPGPMIVLWLGAAFIPAFAVGKKFS
ncbi:MAG: metal ABC transporter permease [Candidatus Bipolaricaulota bacterium]